MSTTFAINDRILAVRLGLGDLEPWRLEDDPTPPDRCWGFQDCCDCKDCLERQRLMDERAVNPPVLRVRFPWEEAA